ncbi:lasso peptide biosynthesis B2 protein [Nocardioides sp. LHD-245]|uniref:lasso peptide biosynthesis B2 protein n=1 Tax=Nocardioides sp. LHD-245 TaxID=3051387 RepID=UPI0027E1AF08|nr:lasso peptide biosynthesis B2 protein [Nocardioides sp. LHD-245]
MTSPRLRLAAATAWYLLGATRLLTVVLPFGVVRRLLGEPAAPGGSEAPAPPDASAPQVARARAVGRAIGRAAGRTPWTSDCYPQALTARILLRGARVPHTVVFGLRRDDAGELRAHAWVTVRSAGGEPVAVTGGSTRAWTPVGAFNWQP